MAKNPGKINAVAAAVICSNILVTANLNAETVELNETQLKAAADAYAGFDGTAADNAALYYLLNPATNTTIKGKVTAGTEASATSVSQSDATPVLHINGLRIADGVVSKVSSEADISLHLTRENQTTAQNKGLSVTGVHARNDELIAQSGSISLSAQTGTATGAQANSNAAATGIYGDINGSNQGEIVVKAVGGSADSTGTGTDATANAYTDGIDGEITGDNRATISSTAIAGSATTSGNGRAYAEVAVTGLQSHIGGSNYGSIYAEARGGRATASGTGFADADATASAIDGNLRGNNYSTLTSRTFGGIAITNDANRADAGAEGWGIYLSLEGDNLGTISVEGTAGTATANGAAGADADADITGIDNRLVGDNKGQILVKAQGGTATANSNLEVDVDALAIGVKQGIGSNSGYISVEATSGTANNNLPGLDPNLAHARAAAFGIGVTDGGVNIQNGVTGQFTNSGHIVARATAGTANGVQDQAFAFGIVLKGDTTLENSGLIEAYATGGAGSEARQVRADGHNLTVTAYGIRFDDNTDSAYTGTIQTNNPNNVTFNNATLYAYNSDSTKAGVAYDVVSLVQNKALTQAQFSQLNTDNITGRGWNAGFVSGTQATANQQVVFSYAPQYSPLQFVARQQQGLIAASQRISAMAWSGMQSESGTASNHLLPYGSRTAGDTGAMYYLVPLHQTRTDSQKSGGYKARTSGMMLGHSRILSPGLSIGVSGLYSNSKIDFKKTLNAIEESVDTYAFGIQAVWQLEQTKFSATSSYYHTRNDYKDKDTQHQASKSYTTDNLLSKLAASTVMDSMVGQVTPEFALSHLWHSRGSVRVDNQTAPDVKYGSVSNHQFSAELSIGWQHAYESNGFSMEARFKPGIRHILGNGGLEDTLRSGANGKADVRNDFDRTVFQAAASLRASRDNLSLSLGLVGEQGKNSRATAAYGELTYLF